MRRKLPGVVGSLAAAAAVMGAAAAPPAPTIIEEPSGATTMTLTQPGPAYSKSGYDLTPPTPAEMERLASRLTDEQRRVLLNKGTEPAFCGNLVDNKKEGAYVCALCGLPLFSSDAKFTSGTGWPSFFTPFDPAHVLSEHDESHGMVRTEILCARCGGHLGHVFEDAPSTPTGLRFCLNSASLEFYEKGAELPAASLPVKTETAYFAGGCFWGVEDRLQQVPGVIDAVSGYMGGTAKDPTYRQVCVGDTGHAETVRIVFDPARIGYDKLLDWFFRIHDPTQVNRQGPDVGTQYRSAVFATTPEQLDAATKFIAAQSRGDRFKNKPIATQVVGAASAGVFYPAEEYHQDYHAKHGGSCPLPSFEPR